MEELEDKIEDLEKEIEDLKERIEVLESENADYKSFVDDVKTGLKWL